MVIIWGQRMYGRVDRFAGSHVATRFFHLYYLPLIPLSSWLVFEERGDGDFVGVQVPMQWRSVLSAWLRVGAIVGLLVSLLHLFGSGPSNLMPYEAVLASMAELALATLVGGYAFLRLGKLAQRDKVARVVYWDIAGRYVDVGLLGEDRGMIRQRAGEQLERLLARHATSGYRDAPQASWYEISTRRDMRDVPLLKAALTLCRIEWAESEGEERQRLERGHALILQNLIAASPELLDTKRFELVS